MRIGAVEVENDPVAFPPHGAFDPERPRALAVIAHIIFEADLLLADHGGDEMLHGAMIALQKPVHAGVEDCLAEAVTDFVDAQRADAARRDDGAQISAVPFRHAAVMHGDVENVLLQFALAVELDRRQAQALLENRPGVVRQGARHLAAHVGHVAEHRRPGDQMPLAEDRRNDELVVGVADRALATVRVVQENDVAVLDLAFIIAQKTVDERAELADDHLAVAIGDERKGVALLANAGRQGRAEQGRVHFNARVSQGVFYDVEGHRIDILRRRDRLGGFNQSGGHERLPYAGAISMFPYGSTVALQPASTSVVESISQMTAGPSTTSPPRSFSRS